MSSVFQEQALNAGDLCSNCFALIRVARPQRESTDPKSATSAKLSPYTRVETTTSVEHAPSERPAGSQTVFCRCGLETPYERLWDGGDRCLTMRRFKDLLKRLMHSLESKGVTLDRETCARVAISGYRDHNHANDALDDAVTAAVQRAAAGHSDNRELEVSN